MIEALLAFLWAPLVLYALALGTGLLVERALRVAVPNALLAPLGLAGVISLAMTVFRLGMGSAVALPVVAIAAGAGLFVARSALRARINPGLLGLAALAGYVLYIAPVALSGDWSWAGYNFVNDTSTNFIFIDLLRTTGVQSAAEPMRSMTDQVIGTGGGGGYPLGSHALVALIQPITGAQVAAVYQPVMAVGGGLGAMSLARLAQRSGLWAFPAVVAGTLAVGATLIYRYSLHGEIKEVVMVAMLATATALAQEAIGQGLKTTYVALVGLCVAAMLQAFGAVSVAYGLTLGALMLGAALLRPDVRLTVRRVLAAAAAGAVAIVVAMAASIPATLTFGKTANTAFGSGTGSEAAAIGHLLRPLPATEAAGVWLARDYRGPVTPNWDTENKVLIAIVLLMALIGLVREVWGRRPAALLLFGSALIPALVLAPKLAPYGDSKLLVVLSPAVVLLAAVGAGRLIQMPRRLPRLVGGLGGALVAFGVLLSAAFGYDAVRLAPPDRMDALTDAGEHAHGGGLWMFNEWEEFGKFFLRGIRNNPTFESGAPHSADLRKPAPLFGFYYDLDAERIGYVTSFPGIIMRVSPDASRPPANFELQYANHYYEVWRRRASPRVIEHLPLQRAYRATAVPPCGAVVRMARRAAPGTRLVAAARPETAQLDTARARNRPLGWPPDQSRPGLVTPTAGGKVSQRVATPGGRYRVWVRGSFGRPVTARVDGREAGKVKGVNTPGQWLQAGTVTLRAGSHSLELERPGRWISPGNGYDGEIGPLALEPVRPERLVSVAPSRATSLCGKPWDWIELVGRA